MGSTQKDAVLEHLKAFGTITSWEAIKEYGATRLSSIIYILRHEGYPIGGEMVQTKNRFGKPVSFKRYMLEHKAVQLEMNVFLST